MKFYLFTGIVAASVGYLFTWLVVLNLNNTTVVGEYPYYFPLIDIYAAGKPLINFPLDQTLSVGRQIQNVFFGAFPTNIFTAAAQQNMLGVVVFSIILASALPRNSQVGVASSELSLAFFKIIYHLQIMTPLVVLSLLIPVFTNGEFWYLLNTSLILLGAILGAFVVQLFFVYPLLYTCLTKMERHPYEILSNLPTIFRTAFTNHKEVFAEAIKFSQELGSKESIVGFVLSLGSALNIDGNALCFPAAVIWLGAMQGIHLCTGQVLVALLVGTVGSIGLNPKYSGIPTVIMAMVRSLIIIYYIYIYIYVSMKLDFNLICFQNS